MPIRSPLLFASLSPLFLSLTRARRFPQASPLPLNRSLTHANNSNRLQLLIERLLRVAGERSGRVLIPKVGRSGARGGRARRAGISSKEDWEEELGLLAMAAILRDVEAMRTEAYCVSFWQSARRWRGVDSGLMMA